MIYFDAGYIARLYLEDPGWEKVRGLAARHPIACSIHGRAEATAAFHRKLREGALSSVHYRHVLAQFALDCSENAYRWFSVSHAVVSRLTEAFETLPKTTFLRASDGIHLACAIVNELTEIYSNDQRLLAAASQFGIQGVDVT